MFIETTHAAQALAAMRDAKRSDDIPTEQVPMMASGPPCSGARHMIPLITDEVIAENKHVRPIADAVKPPQMVRVILIVAIEIGNQATSRMSKPLISGRSDTAVLTKPKHPDAPVSTTPAQEQLMAIIGGAIIDDQHLPIWKRLPEQRFESTIKGSDTVEDRHDD